MNKKDYETAEMEIDCFALEDVICTSITYDDGTYEDDG